MTITINEIFKKRIIILLSIFLCTLIVAACNTQNTDTLEKALIGHWISENGDNLYINKSSIILTEKPSDYRVIDSNEKANWINIDTSAFNPFDEALMEYLKYEKGAPKKEDLYFSPNRNSFVRNLDQGVWKYVDDKINP